MICFWKRLNYKYYLLIVIMYVLLLSIAIGCVFMQTDRVYKQLKFYKTSRYQYLYVATNSTCENDYLECSSVFFYTDRNMKKSLLGDCLMVLEKSTYNLENPIKLSNRLGNREVAVTVNLANQFGLKVGSKVFSKHNINNRVEEYTIVQILPVIYGVLRVDYSINYGVIVMGYDSAYLKNTNYPYVGFSEKDPTLLLQNCGAGLVSLNIKAVYERRLSENIFVWQGITCIMVIFITALYVIIHWKYQKQYYNRLKINGCVVSEIKRQIVLDIGFPGILSLFMSFALNLIILSFYNKYFSWFMSLISVITGTIALSISVLLILQKEKRL